MPSRWSIASDESNKMPTKMNRPLVAGFCRLGHFDLIVKGETWYLSLTRPQDKALPGGNLSGGLGDRAERTGLFRQFLSLLLSQGFSPVALKVEAFRRLGQLKNQSSFTDYRGARFPKK